MAAREHYSAENLGEITVTSNTLWGSACTLSPTLANGADYVVFWSLELVNQSNTTADAQARVTVGGTAQATMNAENRNTSEFPAYAGFFKVTGTGSPLTIALEVKAETNGNNIVARNRRLTVLRMGAGDVYTESTARQAVTAGGTTSFADVLSTSFTPVVGDYLVLGHSVTDNYAATVSAYGRFVWDGTAEGTAEVAAVGHGEIAAGQKNLIPLNKNRVYSEATGGVSRTVTWQGRSHQNGMEAGFSENRLLILRLADFSAYHSARLSELGWVEGSTPTDVLAISPTVTANPHLLLGSWSSNNVSNSTGYVYSRLDDADDDSDAASSSARVFNVADTRGQGAAFAGVRTYTAGVRPISLKVWAGGASEWASAMGGSALALLDLGADDTSVPVTVSPSVGALATTGFGPTVIGAKSATVTPTAGSLSLNGLIPSVSAGGAVTTSVGLGSMNLAGLTPTIIGAKSQTSLPANGALNLTGLAPTVIGAKAVTIPVGLGSISLTGFAPSVGGGVAASVSVGLGAMNLTGLTPAARFGVTLTPPTASASLQGLAPTVIAGQAISITIPPATASLMGFAPTAGGKASASPLTGSLGASGMVASIAAHAALQAAPAAPLALSGHAPTPSAGARIDTVSVSLLISGFAPAVQAGGTVMAQPATGSVQITGATPSITGRAIVEVAEAAPLTITVHEPTAHAEVEANPANDNLSITGFAPDVTARAVTAPLPATLALAPLTPSVRAEAVVAVGLGSLSLAGLLAEVRITSGRPTLTRDRTWIAPRDQTTHVVSKDVTTFKAA